MSQQRFLPVQHIIVMKHCLTNSKHQHIGAKSVVWPNTPKCVSGWPPQTPLGRSRRSPDLLDGWGGDSPLHTRHYPPQLTRLAPRFSRPRRSPHGLHHEKLPNSSEFISEVWRRHSKEFRQLDWDGQIACNYESYKPVTRGYLGVLKNP